MDATLYVIPSSHPSITAQLMLERKGIAYRKVDLLPLMSKAFLRARGFRGTTVPALHLDGRRIQGSLEIARELDSLRPKPPLFPRDAEQRGAVEEAERYGDEVIQPVARRLLWWAFRRDGSGARSMLEGGRIGLPLGVAARTTRPMAHLAVRLQGGSDSVTQADLASLPELLDRVDGWIEDGVLGGDEPNAADLQIAPSVRMLMAFEDLRPAIAERPCGELAQRLVPDFPGRVPAVIPVAWVPAALQPAAA